MYKKSEVKTDALNRTKTIQMIEAAQEVVSVYGKVLEDFSKMGSLYPQSILPFSKDDIKNSIIIIVSYHIFKKNEDEAYFNSLKIGYGMLANFVSDDIASRDEKFNSTVKNLSKSLDKDNLVSIDAHQALLDTDYPTSENERSVIESTELMNEFDKTVAFIRHKNWDAV